MTGAGEGAGVGAAAGAAGCGARLVPEGAAISTAGEGAGAAGSSDDFALVVLVIFVVLRAAGAALAALGDAAFAGFAASFSTAFGGSDSGASTVTFAAVAFAGAAFVVAAFAGVAFGFTVRRFGVLAEVPASSTIKGSSCSFIKLDLWADRFAGRWRKFGNVGWGDQTRLRAGWALRSLEIARAVPRPPSSRDDSIFRKSRAAECRAAISDEKRRANALARG